MRKKMKSHKAMTLYEMIISLAIFAIMCLILVTVGMHIDRVSRATTDLKNKVSSEAPYAANKVSSNLDATKDAKPITISISLDHGVTQTWYLPGSDTAHTGEATIEMDAQKYSTERYYNANKNKTALSDASNDPVPAAKAAGEINGMLNLEFIVLNTTAASSSSTTTTTTTGT
jgi:Tfp pilus assembly protein FimT